mmetsp:Transcript_35362/g.89143  ORF Transcript_35362/g.89143 Transcript_35362/m.89143 type:complete len:279 (-) Transcript_35362:77-913(-)
MTVARARDDAFPLGPTPTISQSMATTLVGSCPLPLDSGRRAPPVATATNSTESAAALLTRFSAFLGPEPSAPILRFRACQFDPATAAFAGAAAPAPLATPASCLRFFIPFFPPPIGCSAAPARPAGGASPSFRFFMIPPPPTHTHRVTLPAGAARPRSTEAPAHCHCRRAYALRSLPSADAGGLRDWRRCPSSAILSVTLALAVALSDRKKTPALFCRTARPARSDRSSASATRSSRTCFSSSLSLPSALSRVAGCADWVAMYAVPRPAGQRFDAGTR